MPARVCVFVCVCTPHLLVMMCVMCVQALGWHLVQFHMEDVKDEAVQGRTHTISQATDTSHPPHTLLYPDTRTYARTHAHTHTHTPTHTHPHTHTHTHTH